MDQIWTTEAAALAGLCRREIAPARLFNDPASDLPTTARGHPSASHSPRQRPPSPAWAAAPATARSAGGHRTSRRATRPAASASKASAAAVPAPAALTAALTAAVGAPASHGRCRPLGIPRVNLAEVAANRRGPRRRSGAGEAALRDDRGGRLAAGGGVRSAGEITPPGLRSSSRRARADLAHRLERRPALLRPAMDQNVRWL